MSSASPDPQPWVSLPDQALLDELVAGLPDYEDPDLAALLDSLTLLTQNSRA